MKTRKKEKFVPVRERKRERVKISTTVREKDRELFASKSYIFRINYNAITSKIPIPSLEDLLAIRRRRYVNSNLSDGVQSTCP